MYMCMEKIEYGLLGKDLFGDREGNSPNSPKFGIGISPNSSYWEMIIGRQIEMLLRCNIIINGCAPTFECIISCDYSRPAFRNYDDQVSEINLCIFSCTVHCSMLVQLYYHFHFWSWPFYCVTRCMPQISAHKKSFSITRMNAPYPEVLPVRLFSLFRRVDYLLMNA